MARVVALPVQSFCIPFLLPRKFYYWMMVNDLTLLTGLRIGLAACERDHRSRAFHPRHRYRLVVYGTCSPSKQEMIREKLNRYRNLALSLERPRSPALASH